MKKSPESIEIRGAKAHNLKNIDVDVPLGKIVGIAGVSGSGKSSLSLGVLYAEGSRRYLESLSTYTRRRMTQASRAQVDEVRYVPASLALHQRPAVPGVRSTFGTMSELLNSLRLMFSRLASHRCPHCGAYQEPTLAVAAEQEIICHNCHKGFYAPGAEELAFNSQGACPACGGTGVIRTVDESTLVPDENLTIDQGAVAPWNSLIWTLMIDVCRAMGVRTDVPFKDLTPQERDIVFHGPAVKKHILYRAKNTENTAELDFTYYNAVYTVENALAKVTDEKGMKRVAKFLKESACPDCGGTRLSEAARAPLLRGISLAQATSLTLKNLVEWVSGVPASLPEPLRPMAERICESFLDTSRRLMDLGLDYLTLDRAGATLSTGERQRVQLARAVRNRTTGVLYVLDEPSIGLHPLNLRGLTGVMDDLAADGNSVVLVDHDSQVLSHADWIIELGPGAGEDGGRVIAEGTVQDIRRNPASRIAPFLEEDLLCLYGPSSGSVGRKDDGNICSYGSSSGFVGRKDDGNICSYGSSSESVGSRNAGEAGPGGGCGREIFADGEIRMTTGPIHTVQPLDVRFPKGRLSVVTGVSGSGKTTMILESLYPALQAGGGASRPSHVLSIRADGIDNVQLIDASPIGINIRSTVATYANIHDELRKVYARSAEAKAQGLKASDFSYNTGSLRCPTCDGTGSISLDVQFLPDVDIPCPDCRGARYGRLAHTIHRSYAKCRVPAARTCSQGLPQELAARVGQPSKSLPEVMAMSIDQALVECADLPQVSARLQVLHDLGLGYLTLGEAAPSLSGGEAQRLKLASEMGPPQSSSVFIFDEPTIGLHPLDVQTLLNVFRTLIAQGATVIVIEHDLQVIRSADWIVDMGPGGGSLGGRIVAAGTPAEVKACPESVTGSFI